MRSGFSWRGVTLAVVTVVVVLGAFAGGVAATGPSGDGTATVPENGTNASAVPAESEPGGPSGAASGPGLSTSRSATTPAIEATHVLYRTPNDVGRVTVVSSFTIPDGVEMVNFKPGTYGSATVVNATNMARGQHGWEVQSFANGTTTAEITYTVVANVTTRGGYESVETPDWAFLEWSAFRSSYGYTARGDVDWTNEYVVDGTGYATEMAAVLGPHSVYRANTTNQSIALVVPGSVSLQVNGSDAASAMAAAGQFLATGGRNREITGFVTPPEITDTNYATSDQFFVYDGFELDADSVLLHEFVHTQQRWWLEDDVEWLNEGSADYLAGLTAYRLGYADVGEFRQAIQPHSYRNAVLQDADSDRIETKNYLKGRYVLTALDARIRQHTGGQRTLLDVVRRLNAAGDVYYADLRRAVVDATNASTGAWLDRYVGTTDAPTLPSDLGAVFDGNASPVADAGRNRSVRVGTTVTLSAANSSDPDGDSLTYRWRQVAGPRVALRDASSRSATFTAPSAPNGTTLTFQLRVEDGRGGTATDRVTISVRRSGSRFDTLDRQLPPNVTAGGTASVTVTARLDGSGGPFSLTEQFRGPVAGATLRGVTVDGTAVSPVVGVADPTGATVTLSSVGANATVNVTYRVTAANATGRITFDGYATSGRTANLSTGTLPVRPCGLGSVAASYDADGDCDISVGELGQAASDYARGALSLSELGQVGSAYART